MILDFVINTRYCYQYEILLVMLIPLVVLILLVTLNIVSDTDTVSNNRYSQRYWYC